MEQLIKFELKIVYITTVAKGEGADMGGSRQGEGSRQGKGEEAANGEGAGKGEGGHRGREQTRRREQIWEGTDKGREHR